MYACPYNEYSGGRAYKNNFKCSQTDSYHEKRAKPCGCTQRYIQDANIDTYTFVSLKLPCVPHPPSATDVSAIIFLFFTKPNEAES